MSIDDELLRRVAADLNGVPGAAERAGRAVPLVSEVNARIAAAAAAMPFDSTPYAFPEALATRDPR